MNSCGCINGYLGRKETAITRSIAFIHGGSCISKGKDCKKNKYGNKSGFVIIKNSGIIIGAMAFEDNPYDGHTPEPQLEQVSDLMGRLPKVALVDRGYKGRKAILGVEIMMPGTGKGKTAYEKLRDRARFRRRAAGGSMGAFSSDYFFKMGEKMVYNQKCDTMYIITNIITIKYKMFMKKL